MAEPLWRWVSEWRRYRNLKTGRWVSEKQVRTWTEEAISASIDKSATLANLIATDQISLTEWHQQFRDLVRQEIVRQYLAGRGGVGKLTPAQAGLIGSVVKDQYKYMDRFAAEIAKGNLTEGQIARRMAMYVNSAREAYERAARKAAEEAEFDEVSWVMNPVKEHCSGDPGCQELSAMGWKKAKPWPFKKGRQDAMPGGGQTPCLTA